MSFSGRFLNDKGKGEKVNLTVVEGNFENVIVRETNDKGLFRETGYQFYDSLEFSFQGKNAKGKIYGKVEIIKRLVPPLNFPDPGRPIRVTTVEKLHAVVSGYEGPKDVRVL